MDRRTFVGIAVCGLFAMSLASNGQPQRKIPRVGVLYFAARDSERMRRIARFRQRLSELGYVDGKTILIEERYADGNAQRLAELAAELTASKADVIVASAGAASSAARKATATIPIVMVHAGNPAGAGLIASLARPGGNVTGTTTLPLGGKHVDLLRELVPRVAKLAILANPTNAFAATVVASIKEAALGSNISVVVAEVTRAEDFPKAFATIRNAHPDGLAVVLEPMIATHGAEVTEFAATTRLPAIYDSGQMARLGGLITYAPVYVEHYALAADYVDKILKGAKPEDMPVQQPARFELIVNLKTAAALGLTIPQSLLQRADEVIQ